MHSEETPERAEAHEIVQNLADKIAEFNDTYTGVLANLETLKEQNDEMREILDAIGPLLIEVLNAMMDNNDIVAEYLDEDREERGQDLAKIRDGIEAVMKSFSRSARGVNIPFCNSFV